MPEIGTLPSPPEFVSSSCSHGSQVVCEEVKACLTRNVRKSHTFIMTPKATCIENDGLIRHNVGGSISLPHIAVDKAWLDMPTTSLHRSQQSWDDLLEKRPNQVLHLFRLFSLCLFLQLKHPSQALYEESFPRICPPIVLCQTAVMCCDMKAEPWRGRLLVFGFHVHM